jgi:putative transposase
VDSPDQSDSNEHLIPPPERLESRFSFLDGASNHRCGDLVVPANITLLYLPPYSPELNPKENLWDEIREKIFKNYALKSMDAVCAKLKQAVLYIERNPKLVRSITAFPYIINSL